MKGLKLTTFSPETREIYEKFKQQAGSEHIAKPVTLEVLQQLCRTQKPKRILEMGGGLGTISYLLLRFSDAFVDIYENQTFYQEKLRENLKRFEGRYRIISSYRMLPPVREYDIAVVDGGRGKNNEDLDGGFKEAVWLYFLYLTAVRTVYVEGHRNIQRLLLCKALKRNYLYKLIRYDDVIYNGEKLNGGFAVYCKPSRWRLLNTLNFLFWELLEWTAVRNFILFRYNSLKKRLF